MAYEKKKPSSGKVFSKLINMPYNLLNKKNNAKRKINKTTTSSLIEANKLLHLAASDQGHLREFKSDYLLHVPLVIP